MVQVQVGEINPVADDFAELGAGVATASGAGEPEMSAPPELAGRGWRRA